MGVCWSRISFFYFKKTKSSIFQEENEDYDNEVINCYACIGHILQKNQTSPTEISANPYTFFLNIDRYLHRNKLMMV